MEQVLGLCALFCILLVAFIVSLVNVGGQKKRDFQRRQALIGHVNQMCGPGHYAFSADYSRLLFVNLAGDLLVYAQWKGSRHEITPIKPYEIMGVRWEENPLKSLARGDNPYIPGSRTAIFLDRPHGPVLGLIMGDEQTAAQWAQIANSVAGRYHAGHGTMRVN